MAFSFLRLLDLDLVLMQLTAPTPWTWWNSMFYAGTLYTTIGYGTPYPATNRGRIFTCIYSLVGIPLFLTILKEVGTHLSKFMRKIYKKWAKAREKCPRFRIYSCIPIKSLQPKEPFAEQDDNRRKNKRRYPFPISLALFMLVFWIFMCAGLFCIWETDWSYGESVYFFFISLSTIGLGDVMPSKPDLMLANFLLILIGLALISMAFNIIQVRIEQWLEDMLKQFMDDFERMAMAAQENDEGIQIGKFQNFYSEFAPTRKKGFRQSRMASARSWISSRLAASVMRAPSLAARTGMSGGAEDEDVLDPESHRVPQDALMVKKLSIAKSSSRSSGRQEAIYNAFQDFAQQQSGAKGFLLSKMLSERRCKKIERTIMHKIEQETVAVQTENDFSSLLKFLEISPKKECDTQTDITGSMISLAQMGNSQKSLSLLVADGDMENASIMSLQSFGQRRHSTPNSGPHLSFENTLSSAQRRADPRMLSASRRRQAELDTWSGSRNLLTDHDSRSASRKFQVEPDTWPLARNIVPDSDSRSSSQKFQTDESSSNSGLQLPASKIALYSENSSALTDSSGSPGDPYGSSGSAYGESPKAGSLRHSSVQLILPYNSDYRRSRGSAMQDDHMRASSVAPVQFLSRTDHLKEHPKVNAKTSDPEHSTRRRSSGPQTFQSLQPTRGNFLDVDYSRQLRDSVASLQNIRASRHMLRPEHVRGRRVDQRPLCDPISVAAAKVSKGKHSERLKDYYVPTHPTQMPKRIPRISLEKLEKFDDDEISIEVPTVHKQTNSKHVARSRPAGTDKEVSTRAHPGAVTQAGTVAAEVADGSAENVEAPAEESLVKSSSLPQVDFDDAAPKSSVQLSRMESKSPVEIMTAGKESIQAKKSIWQKLTSQIEPEAVSEGRHDAIFQFKNLLAQSKPNV